jgi:ankyrin repeat protein
MTDTTHPHGGWTPLHTAAQNGKADDVRSLLAQGADPSAREAGDNTSPLHWAVARGSLEIARMLLDAGADVHGLGDLHEQGVIGWATFFHEGKEAPAKMEPSRRALMDFLVERGARHHIFSAMSVGDLDVIRSVAKQDPKSLDRRMSRFEHKLTPMHFAMNRKRYDIMDVLIELGADLEAGDEDGHSALMTAMLRGDREAMRRLVDAGAKQPTPLPTPDFRERVAKIASAVDRGTAPMISVPDVGATLDWYVSIGFKEYARYEDDGVVNFGSLGFGNAELMVVMHGKAGEHDTTLWFYTDEVDALYQLFMNRQLEAARAMLGGEAGKLAGIEFVQHIYNPFYGGREFGVRDPNGFVLYFRKNS